MSILPDWHIRERIRTGSIGVDPYDDDLIQPASLDVRLGERFISPEGERFKGVLMLNKGAFVLGTTVERVMIPDDLVARLEGKSSWGRKGLIIHATAGYIDPGFKGEVTLELHALCEVKITPGDAIAQLSFHELTGRCQQPYTGRYQNQKGPTRAK